MMDWKIWMIADSALPTGGFVSSNGLEAASQANHVHDLPEYIRNAMHNAALSQLPFVEAAYLSLDISDSTSADTIVRRLVRIDRAFDSTLSNHVAKRTSKAQGTALLLVLQRSFPLHQWEDGNVGPSSQKEITTIWSEAVSKFKKMCRANLSPGHISIAFGILCRCLGVTAEKALPMFMFLQARSMISAAVRMNLVGPYQAQVILGTMGSTVVDSTLHDCKREVYLNAVSSESGNLEESIELLNENKGPLRAQICSKLEDGSVPTGQSRDPYGDQLLQTALETSRQSSPVQDILQGLHDRLYSRLFTA
ncbi:hypothetical protein BJ742DRAFT_742692 [Cladochytrium replicatum]|nr:hypothetical protein BJ742DRAFT_742692 [Cladochytrium replicatum]